MFKKQLLIAGLLIGLSACGSTDQNNQGTSTPQQGEVQQAEVKVEDIGQDKFDSLKDGEDVIVIDVRTPGEVAEGYIEGADMFIDFYANFEEGIADLDKDKTYLMYCRSGGRSGNAADIMVKKGFTKVYNLEGGISRYSGTVVKD